MKSINSLFPFLKWLPLAKKTWKDDLIAGLTGTIIVIPQSVAFAMIAGMPPVYGLYVALIAPVIAALWGSSYHLVSGPTTTSAVVIFSIITQFYHPEIELEAYISMTILLSFMTGVIKFMMGAFKLGKLVDFVSNSVVVGFTAGAGILIAFKQLKYIFDIPMDRGSGVIKISIEIFTRIQETNKYALFAAIFTLLAAVLIKKYLTKIKKFNMLLAMIFGTLITILMGGSSVGIETIGNIPNHLPPFKLPNFNLSWMKDLFGGAVVLALLGLVEAVSISRSIAIKTHQPLDNNQEFIGQGLSNIIPSFFSCYASSGSFTRSAVNYQSGAKTPLSSVVAAGGLLIVLLFGSQYASFLPRPVMAGIILMVGYNLIDIESIKTIYKSSKKELIVFALTLLGTLFLHLEQAVMLGIVVSLFFYLERTANIHIATLGLNHEKKFINTVRDNDLKICPQIKMVRIDGSIYFGALDRLTKYFSNLYENKETHIIIVAHGINFIDLAGAEWLVHEVEKFREKGGSIFIVGAKLISQDVLIKGGFIDRIGKENFYKNKTDAIADMYQHLDGQICRDCSINAFKECK